MAVHSITAFVKVGLPLAAASIALWVWAGAFRVPAPRQPDSAEELGVLDPRAQSPAEEICSLAVSTDGTLLATGTRGGVVWLWEASTGSPRVHWRAHDAGVTALAFSPDSRGLFTADNDVTILRWTIGQTAAPRPTGRWSSTAPVTAVAITPDGLTVAVASGGRLALYDPERGIPLPGVELTVPNAPIRALAFAPDGRALAAGGGGDNAVRVWPLGGSTPVLQLTLDSDADNWVRGLAYTDDGRTLVASDTEGRVRAWDRAGRRLGEIHSGRTPCLNAALGAGGRLLLTAGSGREPARVSRLLDGWWRRSGFREAE